MLTFNIVATKVVLITNHLQNKYFLLNDLLVFNNLCHY